MWGSALINGTLHKTGQEGGKCMTPEQQARRVIDEKLCQAGWLIQNVSQLNLSAAVGVAVREFPTSSGPVDYVPPPGELA